MGSGPGRSSQLVSWSSPGYRCWQDALSGIIDPLFRWVSDTYVNPATRFVNQLMCQRQDEGDRSYYAMGHACAPREFSSSPG
jgi:hypothetical protein